jgi:cytochrome c oxidase assembly factor CtaG
VRALIVLLVMAAATPAQAHGTAAGAPGWTLEPAVVAPLGISLGLFLLGWRRLSVRSGDPGGRGRGLGLFLAGWGVLAAAVVSPLHAVGERSFSAHMAEHELLMLAAAPLLVLSRPLGTMLWAFSAPARKGLGGLSRAMGPVWRAATGPVTATLVQAAVLWIWHAPALFDLALSDPLWHAVQHLSFLVAALLFWSAMLHPRRRAHGVSALCLFATSVVSGALGALMAFSQSPWYAGYAALGLAPLGLTPLEDQQLAGVLMWIPGGVVHAGAALAMIAAALADGREGPVHAVQP